MKRLILFVVVVLLGASVSAWGYWSGSSAAGGSGSTAATTVNAGSTPTTSVSGRAVTLSWSSSTLASGQAVTGYLVRRYDADTQALHSVGAGCASVTSTSCTETDVPAGSWRYSITPTIGAHWRGAESVRSAAVTVVAADTTAPTNSLSLSVVSGDASLSGSTVHYRGSDAGQVRVSNAVTDAGSGPASSTTGNLSGTVAGWSHTGSTVSNPAGGPFVSGPFTWNAGTTSTPQVTVTGRDVAGNTSATTLTFANDATAPTGSSISYADGTASGASVGITFVTGTDGGAGIGTRRLQRASAPLTSGACGAFTAFANLEPTNPTSPYTDSNVSSGTCYRYQYVVNDKVGNKETATNANVVKVDYASAVSATAGLVSHWRLGEGPASMTAYDSFTGANAVTLNGRAADVGGTWALRSGINSAIVDNRVHRNGAGHALFQSSATPGGADYSVEADLHVKTNLTGDMAGVVGRLQSSAATYYVGRWEQADTSWNIVKVTDGNVSYPSASWYLANQGALVAGQNYRIRLEMVGASLKLFVNGVVKVSVTDASPIALPGAAGFLDGNGNPTAASVSKASTTGLHLDNLQVLPASYPRAVDSKGANTGDYRHGPVLGVPGALAGDANTAAQFDGVNDYVQAEPTTGLPTGASSRSVEAWFRTTSSAQQVLFSYGSISNTQEFGLWLNAGGSAMTAWGFGDSAGHNKVFTLSAAVNDGAWHHVVKTYDGTSLTIFIDGVALPSQAATRSTVIDSYGFSIGAVLNPATAAYGSFFHGSIDEVAVYSAALGPATVTDHHRLGRSVSDSAGPSGGSVDATGLVGTGSRYATSTTLNVALAKGTDPSGLAASGAELRRASATLTGGTCGTFGAYTRVSAGIDPASPYVDTVADQACYRYEYAVADAHGNATTYTSPDVKVDTTAPAAPTLAFSAFTNTAATGSIVHYRSTAASGSFAVTPTATDPTSGIANYTFQQLGTGWTATPTGGTVTYSWSAAGPAAPGTKNFTAVNNAGASSAGAPLTMVADDTAPSGGTVSYADTTTSNTTVSVAFTTGTDSGSGLGSHVLERASGPLTDTTCGTFGAFAAITGANPSSPYSDTVTAGSCYRYRYVVGDRVGNTSNATSTNVVKVATAGTGGASTNLALNRPVTVTSTETAAFPGSSAVDGNPSTRWSSAFADPQSITVDLGSLQNLARVRLQWEAAYATAYTVQTSTDGTTWTILRTVTGGDGGIDDHTGLGATGRYVRIVGTARATTYGYSLFELEVYGSVPYADTVAATSALVNWFRLGETTTSSDSFTGAAGTLLQNRSGEIGASWTSAASTDNAVLTPAGRIRKATGGNGARYFSSGAPAGADYTVEADVFVASVVANDMIGVIGRFDSAQNPSYYHVRYDRDAGQWQLFEINASTWTFRGSFTQALTAGATYRVSLDMNGTTVRALVDGVERIRYVDTDGVVISGAGRGGVALGFHPSLSPTLTDTTGMHLDNFSLTPPLADSKGTNAGDYHGGVTLGVPGAIVADASTAAQFDGVNDFATFTRQVADDFSVELWFRSTQGIGTGNQWWQGAGLVDGDVAGTANDFGVSLRSDGRILAGVGNADTSILSSSGGHNDGAWHHVVLTRTRASGALVLYVDGAQVGTATGNTVSLTGPTNLNIGRMQTGANYFAGTVDEVALYTTALSAGTVAAHRGAAQ